MKSIQPHFPNELITMPDSSTRIWKTEGDPCYNGVDVYLTIHVQLWSMAVNIKPWKLNDPNAFVIISFILG